MNYFQIKILLLSFIATVILGIIAIPILKKLKVGQIERDDGPQTHLSKQGTPTMGGVILAIAIAILIVFVFLSYATDQLELAKKLIPLAKEIKAMGLEIACYTGFVFEELYSGKVEGGQELLKYIDVLIDGKFVLSQRSLELMFKGSKNQRTICVPKSLESGKVVLEKSDRWTKKS